MYCCKTEDNAHAEEAAQLVAEIVAINVALRELGDDGLHRVLELAPALEILCYFCVRQVC